MEKTKAIREWCIEKAIEIAKPQAPASNPSVDTIIRTAIELEEYIDKGKAYSRVYKANG